MAGESGTGFLFQVKLYRLYVGVISACTLYISYTIATANYGPLVYTSIVLLLALFFALIWKDWHIGIVTFFLWILFEDAIRKYMQNALIIYMTKDAIVLLTYASYFVAIRGKHDQHAGIPLKIPLVLWFGWALVEVFNPGIQHPLVPLVGLRMHFFYLPLLLLGYAFAADERRLKTLLVLLLSAAVPVSAVGIAQVVLGLDFLNPTDVPYLRPALFRLVPGLDLVVARPVGTFADAGRFAQYLFAMVYVGFGVLGYLSTARETQSGVGLRMWAWFCWLLVWVGLLLTGQRASALWMALSMPLVFLAQVYAWPVLREAGRSLPVARLLLAGAASVVILALVLPARLEAVYRFYADTIDPRSEYSEFSTRPNDNWADIINSFQRSGLVGHGTGTASLGLPYVFGIDTYRSDGPTALSSTESGYASVLWEWGVVGLALWLWWSVRLMFHLVRTLGGQRGRPFYWLQVATTLYAFFVLFPWFWLGMQIYQNYVTQAYLWFFVGVFWGLSKVTAEPVAGTVRQH